MGGLRPWTQTDPGSESTSEKQVSSGPLKREVPMLQERSRLLKNMEQMRHRLWSYPSSTARLLGLRKPRLSLPLMKEGN